MISRRVAKAKVVEQSAMPGLISKVEIFVVRRALVEVEGVGRPWCSQLKTRFLRSLWS
jgi:hypothetical protein